MSNMISFYLQGTNSQRNLSGKAKTTLCQEGGEGTGKLKLPSSQVTRVSTGIESNHHPHALPSSPQEEAVQPRFRSRL